MRDCNDINDESDRDDTNSFFQRSHEHLHLSLEGLNLAQIMEVYSQFPYGDYRLNFCRNEQLTIIQKKSIKAELPRPLFTGVMKDERIKNPRRYVFKTEIGKRLANLSTNMIQELKSEQTKFEHITVKQSENIGSENWIKQRPSITKKSSELNDCLIQQAKAEITKYLQKYDGKPTLEKSRKNPQFRGPF